MKVRRLFFWFFLRNSLFSWIPHPCTSVGLRPAGFGRTRKSPRGLFSGRAGMRFLLVASLPQKRFFLFSHIYLFVQTHSSPSVYLCMCAQMSSRSHSYHPCKIVWGWYKNDKYLAKGNVLEWMNGSCAWRWLWQHSTVVAMISPSVGPGEQRQCPCIPRERQSPGVLSEESPSLKQDTSCPIQAFVLAWIEVWVCA